MENMNEIKLPKGVDRIAVKQHDNKIVIEFIPEEPKFKEGDFVYEDGRIIIVKSYPNMYHANIYPEHSNIVCYNDWYGVDFSSPTFRHATEEEKQLLIDKMRKDGKRWNAEKLEIEDIPKFKRGDFVYEDGRIMIVKEYPYKLYALIFPKIDMKVDYDEPYADYLPLSCLSFRYATEEEKKLLIDAMKKDGKRWNADKKCIEDIPKRKFKAGDKVRIKAGISSETHRYVSPHFTSTMNEFIGKELTVEKYNSRGFVVFFGRYFEYEFDEDWLEPWSEEPKNGDLAIFWDYVKDGAIIRLYDKKGHIYHYDSHGMYWNNAIKFESKEQFEKFLRGEI